MSQKKKYHIACPSCGEEIDVDLYEAVNIAVDPALRESLMENRLNTVDCTACDYRFRIDKPLLYNDPGRRWMIYWIPLTNLDYAKAEEDFRAMQTRMTALIPEDMMLPELHLVFTRTELVERIFLREAELNVRIIEYIKYIIFSKNIEQLIPAAKVLLFNAEDSTEEKLVFVVQDEDTRQLESVFEYQRSAYDGLCEMFDQDEQTATLYEMFPGPHISARRLLLQEQQVTDT